MTRRRVLVALLLSLSLITAPSFAAVKAGAKCTKAGSTATASGKKFTCIKSGTKLVWNKGVAIKAAAPKPSPTPEAKIEVKNLLASDSRITATSALTAIDVCKTEDMTPDYMEGGQIAHRNGFPRPPRTVSGEKSAKVLVIPLSFTDLPFRDQRLTQFPALLSDVELIKEAIPNVRDSFRKLSGGRFDIQFDVLPKSEWWVLNTDSPFSGNWGVPNIPHIMEIIKTEKSDFNFDGYDTFAFVTGAGYPGQAGLGGAQASYGEKVKNSKSGYMNALLMLGALSNATLWVHELGHSLFSFEDLYLFSQAASGRQVTTGGDTDVPNKWDLMADANKYSLLQWNKLLMGWVYDTEFRCIKDQNSSVHYLSLDNPNNDTKLLTVNLAPGVTLAAEARQAPRVEGAGLLLYVIDTYTPHGEGPIITQNNLVGKGQSKSWLGWTFNVLDSNDQGILIEAIKTDINKFVPPPPKPQQNNPGQPISPIRVTKGDIVPDGFLKAKATWNVTGHESYRLYITDTVDFQKVYFETGYVNDSRNPLVIEIKGLVCNKEFRTMTEFFTKKNGEGERLVIPSLQLRNLSCEDTSKKP
jgi:M6 family metalloprotease-like protein